MKRRQQAVRLRTSTILTTLMMVVLSAPALFGRQVELRNSKLAALEYSPAAATTSSVPLAASPSALPEQIHQLLLPGEAPVLTPETIIPRQLTLPAGDQPAPATPRMAANDPNYRWDSSLWGRLDCLRQQRMRQRMFGSRAQRCSLG